jgi:hypothetical protein
MEKTQGILVMLWQEKEAGNEREGGMRLNHVFVQI